MSTVPAPLPREPSRRTSTVPKRASILPKPSSVTLDPSALIAQHAQLTGSFPITISTNCVLHPHSKISSALAPVNIGEGCVIHERAKVGVGMSTADEVGLRGSWGSAAGMGSARSSASLSESVSSGRDSMSQGVFLAKNVVLESNAVVEAAQIGEGSFVEVGAVVGKGCVLGKHCTISAGSYVAPNSKLPDYTVVFSGSEQRLDQTLILKPEILEAKKALHTKQLDMFKKLVPNHAAKWV